MAIPKSLTGDSWSATTARRVLPLLVAYAQSARPITYGDLSREATKLGLSHYVMPLAYRYVAGAIGYALEETEGTWGEPIPPINALVINEGSGLPGKGVDWFVKNYLRETGSEKKLTAGQRASIIEEIHKDVYNFSRWNELLKEYGLSPLPTIKRTPKPKQRAYQWSNEGESEAHQKLKNLIAANPSLVGLPSTCPNGDIEFMLPSADKIDVLFHCEGWDIAVEVKGYNAVDDDLERGIYQCIKYRELLRAVQRVAGTIPQSRSVLVIQRTMPPALERVARTLKVEWYVVES